MVQRHKENYTKKVSTRQCISCRTPLPRTSLIRLTKVSNSQTRLVVINPNKYQFGRSAYICNTKECINKAIKEKKIAKMLRAPIDNSIIVNLQSSLLVPLLKEVSA